MATKKHKFHLFTVKILRAPPGAQPFVFKIKAISKREAFFELYGRLFLMQQGIESEPLLPFKFDESGLTERKNKHDAKK